MEALAGFLTAVRNWWASLPGIPPLGLPVPGDPEVLIVIATVLLALGLTALISGWVEKRLSWVAVFTIVLSAALFFWVWEGDRDGFGWISVPEAFVELVARVLR
ncbi:hypothetical protein [Jannaschia sp. M317]|uniref:hypothetical protein n=1 Tax=Jannaschia sp. M317 TaxID=2867011 RepID=UPI0021A744E5|nr:hypothetical protein [Jannaschia sp. M317]UWQ18570.1 hypothetical protein K3551_04555 [Jannaschia sp. M317]